MLGDRHGDSVDIDLLEGILAQQGKGHVAGDGNDRNTVHIGSCDSGHQVGGSGAAGRHADADFSGRPGVSVGGVGSALLVGCQIVMDFVSVFVKSVIYIQDRTAGIAEHCVNTLFKQALNDDIRTG